MRGGGKKRKGGKKKGRWKEELYRAKERKEGWKSSRRGVVHDDLNFHPRGV